MRKASFIESQSSHVISGPLDKIAYVRHVRSWSDLAALQEQFSSENEKWIYRGLRSAKWNLETTLERAVRRFDSHHMPTLAIEGGLIRQFQRRAHHYLLDVPENEKWIEWLSLMQHHGGPTRLMDWTYSFNVALHFAIEAYGLEKSDKSCVIWGFELNWMEKQLKRILSSSDWRLISKTDRNLEEAKTFKRIFANRKHLRKSLVCAVNPFRLNQRLSIQQGIFLCPGDISKPFQENLASMFPATKVSKKLVKCIITFDEEARKEVARRLIRMNMTRTTLFPGLDGFASSLALHLANPVVLEPSSSFPID
jgi:FRG domain